MIKAFISRVFSRRKPDQHAPTIYAAGKHGINRHHISQGALRVCEGLHREGFAAFVVGGAVRDLMLGRQPKDFDVATNATPEEVRGVFRRSRIIGRRFRLVHVMFGGETVEVSTFRAAHARAEGEDSAQADEHGRLLRDNVFGSQEEDAIRRDFTVNALFYDPEKDEVWDYLSGVADLRARKLVMIGDPEARYREDPVRMLRAARLSAKLGFKIDSKTRAPIGKLQGLLDNVPPARLFDELLKMLVSGGAGACIAALRELGLHRSLLPFLDEIHADALASRFVGLALQRTDERIAADKGVSPAFLLACLLWPLVQKRVASLEGASLPLQVQWHQAMEEVLETQRRTLAIPRKLDAGMTELWAAQPRFAQRGGARPYRLLTHPRFRACYDFLLLRAEAGDEAMELADWWTAFQDADEDTRKAMLQKDDSPRKKRRRRTRRGGRAAGAGDSQGDAEAPEGHRGNGGDGGLPA